MEPDDGVEDDGPFLPWVSPDDRLWRHPSEAGTGGPAPEGRAMALPVLLRAGSTRTWSLAVVAGVVGALLATSVGMATGGFGHTTTVVRSVTRTAGMSAVTLADSASATSSAAGPAAFEQAASSVMPVDVASPGGSRLGSGVLYARSGREAYLVINADLTVDGGRISVGIPGSAPGIGHLVGTDPTTDLAVISVLDVPGPLPTFGSVAQLQLGETVMGVDDGTGGQSLWVGALYSADQTEYSDDNQSVTGLLGITGPTPSPGDAGGAVVTQDGSVVGVTTDLVSPDPTQSQTSFALPIDMVARVASAILDHRPATHPWLGITETSDVPTATAHLMGMAGGAEIDGVADVGPARAIHLAPDDVIVSFDNQAVTSSGLLTALIDQCTIGDRSEIRYLHKGKAVTATISVVEQPAEINQN